MNQHDRSPEVTLAGSGAATCYDVEMRRTPRLFRRVNGRARELRDDVICYDVRPGVATEVRFEVDDLSREPVRALIARHLEGMFAASPPESVHAFDVDKLRAPDVTFFSAWVGVELAGCGALKQLDAERGELKSMRVADRWRGKGIGRAMLGYLLGEARRRGMKSLWLETGSTPPFTPALRLYESAGFVRCGPFDGYVDDPFSIFMTLTL